MNDGLESDLVPTALLLRVALRSDAERMLADSARNDAWLARLVTVEHSSQRSASNVIVDVDLQAAAARRRSGGHWWTVAAAAVVLLALVAVVAARGNRSEDLLRGEGERYYVLPGGPGTTYSLSSATHGSTEPLPLGVDGMARIYTQRADGTLRKALLVTTVHVGTALKRGFPIDEPTIVIDGNVGHIQDDAGNLSVRFEDDFACGVVVVSAVSVDLEAFKSVVSTVQCVTDARGSFAALDPPVGFTLEAENGPERKESWSLDYRLRDSDQYVLSFERTDDAVDLSALLNSTGAMTNVRRGPRDYWVTTIEANNDPDRHEVDVYWRDGAHVIHLESYSHATDDVIAVADSVREVTKTEFERHIATAIDRQRAPSAAPTIAGPAATQQPTQPGVIANALPAGWQAIHVLPSTKPFALGLRHAATGRTLSVDWSTSQKPPGSNAYEISTGTRTISIERFSTGTALVATVQVGGLSVTLSGSATDEEITQIAAGLQPANADDYARYNTSLPIVALTA